LNDLISNVLARSLGSLPTIQPRLPSMFEPYRRTAGPSSMHAEAAFETASEVEQVAVPTFPEARPVSLGRKSPPYSQRLAPATEHRTTVHDAVPASAPNSPIPGPDDWQESHQPLQEYSAKLRMPAKETTDELPEPKQPIHRERRTEEMVRVVQTKRYLAVEENESPQGHIAARIAEHAASANPSPVHSERITAPPLHTRGSVEGLDQAPRITDNPSEPAIQVTIGKVEVRAIFPEPSRPAPPAPSRPTLSLDNYLQKRSRSGR
jgi:hypothetical protein